MANPKPQNSSLYRLDYNANFRYWRINLYSVLDHNQVKYVLTEPKPAEPTTTTPQNDVARHQKWILDDFTARHVILGSLHERVYLSYHHHNTAASLFDALTTHFTRSSMSRRLNKFRRYMEHKLDEEGKSVNEHVREMGLMAAELESEGVKVSEEFQVLMLMNSLPDRWDDMVGGLVVNMDIDGSDEMGLDKASKRIIDLVLKKHQEENPNLYVTLKVAREKDLVEQIGKDIYFDLVDHEKVTSFCVLKETPFYRFKEEVAKEFGIPVQYQRYWRWMKRENQSCRPFRPYALMEETASVKELTKHSKGKLFLEVELGPDLLPIAPPDRTRKDILIFFKLYDPEKEELRYVGRLFVNLSSKPIGILSKLNELAGYALDQEIDLYEEISFRPEVIYEAIDKNSTFGASQLEDGDIVWFQKQTPVENGGHFRYPNVPSFLESLPIPLIAQR